MDAMTIGRLNLSRARVYADVVRHSTNAHIKLLHEIHEWACCNHDLEIQMSVMKRLEQLGWPPQPRPRPLDTRDEAQRDYDEEADAHGVTVREILG